MGGSSTPAKTDQVSKVELPAWVNEASQSNYDLAKSIASRPLEQFQGQTVAAPSSMTTQGYGAIQSGVGAEAPIYKSALDLQNKATGVLDQSTGMYNKAADTYGRTAPLQNEAADIYRGTAGNLDIQPFLNPYTKEVEENAIRNANTSLDRNLLGVSDTARKSGAFGGSRGEIESALTRSEGIKGIGDLSAKLRAAGFDTATSTALADRTSKQNAAGGLLSTAGSIGNTAAGYGNVGAGLGGAAAGMGNISSGMLNTASGQQGARLADINSLMSGGQSEQASRQALIDAEMKKFYEARDYPIEGLNTRLAALGMSPYGKTETTNKTATSEDKGPDWASILLGGAKIGAQMYMSDRNAKTDIEKISGGDIPVYAYRYKGDPKTYPKVVGPMAQDIEKKYPSAVKKVGKRKVVDLNNLMEVLS